MKQRNASSFATLRIFSVLAMLGVLPVSPASAIPIQLTGGGIGVDLNTRTQDFFHTFVGLRAPGFELTTDPRYDLFSALEPLAPLGSTVNFSGGLNIVSAANPSHQLNLFYGGRSYWATGFIVALRSSRS